MEAARFGLRSYANELNPVASFILQATMVFPAKYGLPLVGELEKYGRIWIDRIKERLSEYYPSQADEKVLAYIWTPMIACPDTGKPTPLQHYWWLSKPPKERIFFYPIPNSEEFKLDIFKDVSLTDPSEGTYSRGKGRSIWKTSTRRTGSMKIEGETIPSEYIKRQFHDKKVVFHLSAVRREWHGIDEFRLSNKEDLMAIESAEKEFQSTINDDLYQLVPDEAIYVGQTTRQLNNHGLNLWSELFSARQLIVAMFAIEEIDHLYEELTGKIDEEQITSIISYLACTLSKILDRNSKLCTWEPTRCSIAHTFQLHAYTLKWGHAEMNVTAEGLGFDWAMNQVKEAYKKIAESLETTRNSLFPTQTSDWSKDLKVTTGDAAALDIDDKSIEAIVMDPPYYDSIQYSELSDFFYVWLKRSVGDLYPGWFDSYLSEKDQEAVMNEARFKMIDKKRAKQMARDDYERKMVRIFGEAGRVLRDDGVLTVMFNHKTVEAWDTLARSIIEAGFQIVSSWPVHTESQHSLHQARKAAVVSTIMLGCRKRLAHEANGSDVWWEDIQDELRMEVERCATDFLALGIGGVDLFVSVFGPALSVISQRWPVLLPELDRSGKPKVLSPDDALDLARGVVVGLLRDRLVGGRRVVFDGVSDWYLLAWDVFSARSFPYDEARKLALAFGVGMDDLKRSKLVSKKTSNTVLTTHDVRFPKEKVSGFAAEDLEGVCLVDRAHMLMSVAVVDRTAGIDEFVHRGKLTSDPSFLPYLQALLKVIPRTRDRERQFLVPEAHALDEIAVALSLDLPTDPPPPTPDHHQTTMDLDPDS